MRVAFTSPCALYRARIARLPGTGGSLLKRSDVTMASRPFTLTQLARAVGMRLADVRFYRDSGLLPPARRQRGRTDDFAFQEEHVERLTFIKRALDCGFTQEDITLMVNPAALVTCGDVYAVAARRLEQLRQSGAADTEATVALARLLDRCAGVGPRKDCQILATLAETTPTA